MIIATTIDEVREHVMMWRRNGLTVGLVPTMGYLHEGHASLVETAVQQCDRVVASVFVNPTQFCVGEDLESYPRDFDADCRLLEAKGCDLVFHPEVSEMYPEGYATYVNVESDMTAQLCGKSRPGHFRGVCTVVSKLFQIVTPDCAFFGQKDAQQLAVIRRMVWDQAIPVKIIGCPIVREADGLAKSSRNTYLNEAERQAATVLYKAVCAGQKVIQDAVAAAGVDGNGQLPENFAVKSADVLAAMNAVLDAEPLANVDYVEAVDGMTMQPAELLHEGDLVALAVKIGKTRLIDNFSVYL